MVQSSYYLEFVTGAAVGPAYAQMLQHVNGISDMTDFALSPATRYWRSDAPLALELGGTLSHTLAYRSWGQLSPDGDNAVIVCHPLTGSADVDVWWSPLFGPCKALDPTRDFIVCSNVLGGCYGSTGPTSIDAQNGYWAGRFPKLTIRDQVRAQIALAHALGIRRIKLVIGGSMGGLQALEWALLDPERVESLAVIAASAQHSAWCIAWSEAQRMAIRADPKFRGGDYPRDDAPCDGLGAARAIAMATYRSDVSLGDRCGRESNLVEPIGSSKPQNEFAARDWMRHHAETFVRRFDANCYMTLIDAMDRHDVGHDRGGASAALTRIERPVLVIAISSDGLYPPWEQKALFEALPNANFAEVSSMHGHDGFLVDASRLEPEIMRFRTFNMRAARSALVSASEAASSVS